MIVLQHKHNRGEYGDSSRDLVMLQVVVGREAQGELKLAYRNSLPHTTPRKHKRRYRRGQDEVRHARDRTSANLEIVSRDTGSPAKR